MHLTFSSFVKAIQRWSIPHKRRCARGHIAAPDDGSIQILIEATPNYLNVGDLAMLQVSVARLRSIWPQARITVFTTDAERLQLRCPGLLSVPAGTRSLWFRHRSANISAAEAQAENPATRELLIDFACQLKKMNLFVISGMGSYHDAGGQHAVDMLDTIRLMRSLGVPGVAFSQGIGPIDKSSIVWSAAQRSLPCLEFIALREARSGPALLRELGVASDRFLVTGDDAIECAYRERPPSLSHLLGLNLRVAFYSGITTGEAQRLSSLFQAIAQGLGATLIPAPISFVPGESDLDTFAHMFPGHTAVAALDSIQTTPEWAIEEIGRCRMVITGAYHAAVFALSQGIPAICIQRSAYYRDKFLGLAAQFGNFGCQVIAVDEPDFESRIRNTAEDMWHMADRYRKPLLRAAAKQIRDSKAAWAELS
jgi:colanic acid/amylovoran biosynthesis protein